MYGATVAILASHLLFLFESLPLLAVLAGFGAHGSYLWLLQSYPFISFTSPPFLTSLALFVLSNFLYISHFLSHFHQLTSVLCFMLWMAWLVPFGFFISVRALTSLEEKEDAPHPRKRPAPALSPVSAQPTLTTSSVLAVLAVPSLHNSRCWHTTAVGQRVDFARSEHQLDGRRQARGVRRE